MESISHSSGRRAARRAAADLGYSVVNCGKGPSPALALLGLERGIPAVMVTGSHIPADRNGIKFNKCAGEVLKEDEAGITRQVVELPDGLFDATMTAMDREAEPASTIVTRRHSTLIPHYSGSVAAIARQVFVDFEFKLIAYSLGLVLSFAMFTSLLASMRPMMSLSPFVPESEQNLIWMTRDEGLVLNMTHIPGAYSLPRIARGSELPDVAENVDFSSDDNLVLIAEIAPDGRGQIVEVLSGPHDPKLVGELAVAMNRPRSFIPSYAPTGMAVPTRVVLCFERMDILG